MKIDAASEVRKLWIEGSAGKLEATLRVARSARAAALVAHPHPLHGGTLDNPVVFHADRELHRAGLTTMRFNFRGVGESEGSHDEGRGETDDVSAAMAWLRGICPGRPLLSVGFSFGSLCSIRNAVGDPSVHGVIAIGLPVLKYPFEELARLQRPFAVVQADDDEFGRPSDIEPYLERIQPKGQLHVIENTTHLFPGRAPDAGVAVVKAAESMLQGHAAMEKTPR